MTVWTAGPRARWSCPCPGGACSGLDHEHIIHHRAELTVYLRLLDLPVPALYGPSADEA